MKQTAIVIEFKNIRFPADMSDMFKNMRNLKNIVVKPQAFANVTNMRYMFAGAINFNQNIGDWEVGKVTNMSSIFNNARAFNGDIRTWNVSNVTDMLMMFCDATSFNQPLHWNVSNVTNMGSMFAGASSLINLCTGLLVMLLVCAVCLREQKSLIKILTSGMLVRLSI